jgi:hypothetical protein
MFGITLTDDFQYHDQYVDTDNIPQWDKRKICIDYQELNLHLRIQSEPIITKVRSKR